MFAYVFVCVLQNLARDPEARRWYVQAELVHCRTAMAGVAGILIPAVSMQYSSSGSTTAAAVLATAAVAAARHTQHISSWDSMTGGWAVECRRRDGRHVAVRAQLSSAAVGCGLVGTLMQPLYKPPQLTMPPSLSLTMTRSSNRGMVKEA